jgi:hypothetical protein
MLHAARAASRKVAVAHRSFSSAVPNRMRSADDPPDGLTSGVTILIKPRLYLGKRVDDPEVGLDGAIGTFAFVAMQTIAREAAGTDGAEQPR